MLKRFCFPDGNKLPAIFDSGAYDKLIGEFGLDTIEDYIEDIWGASNLMIYSFLTCILCFFMYSTIIYHFTGLVIWVSMVLVGLGLFILSVKLQQYHDLKYGVDDINNYGTSI